MAEKINGTHLANPKTNGEPAHAEDIQRCAYISALQSHRVTVLVGPTRVSFQVPQDLLTQYSPVLGERYRSVDVTGAIELPEVKTSTFEDFFIWLHMFEPRIGSKSFQAAIDLAILAETHRIYHLKNQISDLLRREFDGGQWKLTPDILSMVYNGVPSGSILRQLCASAFAITSQRGSSSRQHDDYLEWKTTIETLPELGWDYFVQMQNTHSQPASIIAGGDCRFHDHSDILFWEREHTDHCPYPHGAPFTIPKSEPLAEEVRKAVEMEKVNEEAPSEEVLPEPKVRPEPEASPKPKVRPEPEASPKPKVQPEPEVSPEPEVEPEQPTATPKKKKKKGKAAVENRTVADGSSVTSG